MKKNLFILILLQTILYSEVTICDKLAGNPLDNKLESEGISFKDIVANKAIIACKKDLEKKPKNTQIIYQLGRAYDKNENYTKAIKYYKKACDKKYAAACNSLGIKYYYGKGIEESDEIAVEFYKKACKIKTNSSGCTNIAGMYHYGKGVKQSYNEAKKYYLIACNRGDNYSCRWYKKLNFHKN